MILKSKILVKLLSFNFARAMAIFPFILINNESLRENEIIINHEKIHLRQQVELLIIGFYILYFLEYFYHLLKLKKHRLAYENISFEKEAYCNEMDLRYLNNRKLWTFLKYI